jgi:queuine/archaeosine tRNA-ribosyltransferase
MTLPHGDVLTPVYMPVGTKGAMKGFIMIAISRRYVSRNGRHGLPITFGKHLSPGL